MHNYVKCSTKFWNTQWCKLILLIYTTWVQGIFETIFNIKEYFDLAQGVYIYIFFKNT